MWIDVNYGKVVIKERVVKKMDYQDYVDQGLSGDEPLKIILRGHIDKVENNKVGVVSVILATMDRELAKQKMQELNKSSEYPDAYYMVYSVPLDTDLSTLTHYPSVAITKDDLSE